MTVLYAYNLSVFKCPACHLLEIEPETIPQGTRNIIDQIFRHKVGSYSTQISFISIKETIVPLPDGRKTLQSNGAIKMDIKPETEDNLLARVHKCMQNLKISTETTDSKGDL